MRRLIRLLPALIASLAAAAKGEFTAIKGNWAIQAYLSDTPPRIPGALELELAAGEAQIKQLEENSMKSRLTVIGQVAAGSV